MKMPNWNHASPLRANTCAIDSSSRRRPPCLRFSRAFNRLELLALISTFFLLMLVSVPLGANVRTRTDRLVCEANLGKLGHAYHLWASEHGDQNPFLVGTNDGGIFGVPLANNIWFQYAWISNELVNPGVLACPSDRGTTRVASDFSNKADGGFLNPTYRNNAVSYFLGLHSFFYSPRSILSGDRNVGGTVLNIPCTRAGLPFTVRFGGVGGVGNPPFAVWTNSIHGLTGNLLFNDGSVQETSSMDLGSALGGPETELSQIHALVPP
jgi:hypothetical protein